MEDAYKGLRDVVEGLEDRVERIDTLLKGDPEYSKTGLIERQKELHKEQTNLKLILNSLTDNEARREEEAKRREEKRDQFQRWVYGLLAAIIAGIVVNLAVLYFSGLIGGG